MTKLIAMSVLFSFITGCYFVATTAPAEAGYKKHVNHRQWHQQSRIYKGVTSGNLNRREAGRMQKQQMRLAGREAKMRRGGLSRREAGKLNRQQNKLSKNIYKQKHD